MKGFRKSGHPKSTKLLRSTETNEYLVGTAVDRVGARVGLGVGAKVAPYIRFWIFS